MTPQEDKSLTHPAGDGIALAGDSSDTSVVSRKRETDVGTLTQWQLIRRRFKRHRMAMIALNVLIILYVMAAFCEFFAPYPSAWRNLDFMYAPPQLPRFNLQHGWYAEAIERHQDTITFQQRYAAVEDEVVPLSFFVKGEPYKMFGLLEWDRHFFGVDRRSLDEADIDPDRAVFYFLGADKHGHDIFSRLIYGARVSLSIGLLAISITTILGIILGGISGYMGGWVDDLIQRTIEIVRSFPQLPLWLVLGAILPSEWPLALTYLGITVILSILGWTGLARTVRGKILSLREEDYAVAARLMGASNRRILFRHLVPGFTSHIIVIITISIPGMILGETAMSFLGLGLRPPVVSWGVMLQDAMQMQVVAVYPWILMPVVIIGVTVLAFNFVGDGMRDAADPYH